MYIVCSDLEGVFVPEIWVNISKQTGIEELRLTTRDISDYDVLMKRRLELLKEHGLTLHDIQKVISMLKPLPGAFEFVDWLRTFVPLIVVSDTFTEFAEPLIKQLGKPVLFCHNLTVDTNGNITNYNLRQKYAKMKVAEALQSLNYKVIAIGDSYNDLSMLRKADHGLLFNAPQKVIDENSDLMVINSFDDLKQKILEITDN
jgi:phosphoserine/homoserine phosphotransferase